MLHILVQSVPTDEEEKLIIGATRRAIQLYWRSIDSLQYRRIYGLDLGDQELRGGRRVKGETATLSARMRV